MYKGEHQNAAKVMQKSTFMAKSPNAEDCSSNQAIFLELKKQGEEVGMGQQRAIRELSQSLAALPEALCIGKKKKKKICADEWQF